MSAFPHLYHTVSKFWEWPGDDARALLGYWYDLTVWDPCNWYYVVSVIYTSRRDGAPTASPLEFIISKTQTHVDLSAKRELTPEVVYNIHVFASNAIGESTSSNILMYTRLQSGSLWKMLWLYAVAMFNTSWCFPGLLEEIGPAGVVGISVGSLFVVIVLLAIILGKLLLFDLYYTSLEKSTLKCKDCSGPQFKSSKQCVHSPAIKKYQASECSSTVSFYNILGWKDGMSTWHSAPFDLQNHCLWSDGGYS